MNGIRADTDALAVDPIGLLERIERLGLDLHGVARLEVTFDRTQRKLWVNVNGVCALRAAHIESLSITEVRT